MKKQSKRSKTGSRGGFTLIEILLVVVIIGILVGVALPRLGGRKRQAEISAARADIENISTALNLYELDNGEYPPSLDALISSPGGAQNWNGPYLQKGMPKDPWGNPYLYQRPGSRNPHSFDLSSSGPGGEGGVQINNWSRD